MEFSKSIQCHNYPASWKAESMRRKLLSLLFIVFVIAWLKPDWIKNSIPGEQVIKTFSTNSSISLDPYAKTLGGTLASPLRNRETVNGIVTIAGSVRDASNLSTPYVWIQVTYLEKKRVDLPTSMQYYTPLTGGDFSQHVRLFQGEGKYSITLRVPGEEKNTYYPFATFEVINQSSSIARDISYSPIAYSVGLQMDFPLQGYQVQANALQIEGEFSKPFSQGKVLIQVRKGKKVWRKVVLCTEPVFRETIPLLFGKGIHEIQVMIPDGKRKEYYLEGATFFVKNQSDTMYNPIQYTKEFDERGIKLTAPIAGGSHNGLTYRVAGSINPRMRGSKNTQYMVVKTTKGKDEAMYFIPIKNDHFDGHAYFRFGSGLYTVDLLVPENTTQNRDYFRFFTAAECNVLVQGVEDVRDLVPSRGIECNDVRMIRLATQIVKNKSTNMEKARAIYKYVAQTMRYDVQKLKRNTFSWRDSSIKALETKKGVCQDYVFLTVALLRAAGIPSHFVEGMAQGQAHAWVESLIGNRWISMDPTWGSGYITNGQFIQKLDMTYFNPSLSQFRKTHRKTGILY